MSLHVHRNSFNAGEISPLMDARLDEAKHPFSCRILENFIPKIYGGAFRRPGTMYLATQHDLAEWTENTHPHRIEFADSSAPTVNDDTPLYEVGSMWLRNVRAIYKPSDVTAGAAVWATVSATHQLYAYEAPTADDDTNEGYSTSSIWYDQSTGAIYKPSSVSAGAAVWVQQTATNNLTATAAPTVNDDTNDGYTTSSYWIVNTRSLYECTDDTNGAAVWATVSGTNNLVADRVPTGADTGYTVGKFWVWKEEDRIWELTADDNQEAVRLLDFNVSATTRYTLALGDGYLRIYNDDGTPFLDELNSPYNLALELATPYLASEIFEVQIAQLGNLAYFAHPNHPPQKLERSFNASFAAATFVWSEVDWSFPAFRDTNNTEVTATPSATTGSPVSISFTANPFTETMDYSEYSGARIMLSQRRSAAHVKIDLTATANSSSVSVLGEFSVYTYGTFTGTLRVQAKDKSGAWVTTKSFEFSSETDGRQIVYRSSREEATDMRLSVTYSSGSGAVAYLEADDSRRIGYARIHSGIPFADSLPVVPCEVELDFDSTDATTEWAIESWAEYAGYPRSVCFHEQRLWFGGTELQPNTIWASVTNDFENFRRGPDDDDSIAFTLAAQEGSAVQSLVSHDALVIFTQSEEWTASTSQQTAITPSNLFVRRQSRFGSSHRQAFVAANNLLFLQRGARKLRQFTYSGTGGGEGQASDLTLLAEHVTQSGINQLAFQQQPDPVIWAIRNDGVLISLTYEPDQNVIAWARHTSGTGLFESVAVIYGDEGDADQVWFVVNRGGTRFLERFDPDHFTKLDDGTAAELVYLDSAVLGTGTDITTLSGLDHLEGETVDILADGGVEPSDSVSSGDVTIEDAADTIIAGIPYTSKLQPSKIEVALEDGTAQGRKFLAKRATLNVWKSYGFQYSDDPDATEAKWFNALGRDTETDLGDPDALFTGQVDIINLGGHKASVDFTIRQTLPLPCNILAIIPKIEIGGT